MLSFLDLIKKLYAVKSFHGYTDKEIDSLKQLFGNIPAVLEEYYRTAGKTKEFQYGQDLWVKPEEYKGHSWYNNIDGMVILNENQGVCQACIKREDLSLPDPPIYNNYNEDEWELCASSVSEFLVSMLAYNSAFMFEYSPEDFYCIEDQNIKEFQSRLEKYPFEIKSWIGGIRITFYNNSPGNLAVVMEEDDNSGYLQLIYGASGKDAYNKLQKALEDICEPF